MKSLKRALAMCAALALVLTNSGYIIDTAAADEAAFVVKTSKTELEAGDIFKVTVDVENNTGLNGWKLNLDYDDDVFELNNTVVNVGGTNLGLYIDDEGEEYDFFEEFAFAKNNRGKVNTLASYLGPKSPFEPDAGEEAKKSPLVFIWIDQQGSDGYGLKTPYTVDGTMFSVYLKVKDGAASGEYTIDLNFDPEDITYIKDGEETQATFTSKSAKVKVGGDVDVPVTSVSAAPTSKTLTEAGETFTITPTVLPDDATDKSVTYTSSKPGVATVDVNGKVTAVANGETTITVASKADPTKTAEVKVTVDIPVAVTSVTAAPTSKTLTEAGETFTITPTVLPDDATDKSVTYTSSKPGVATVDANGKVTAVANGETTITVASKADPTKTAEVKVTVKIPNPVTKVEAAPASITLKKKTDSEKITVTVTPADADDTSVTFKSNDESVATVDAEGNVKPVANGTTTVTVASVADPTKTATVNVTVDMPVLPTAIDATKTLTFASKDDAAKAIEYTVTPAAATDKSVTFTSGDTSIATVDTDGNVTPKGEGATTITIKSVADPDVTATVSVSVAHKHVTTEVPFKDSTWKEEGNKKYYTCEGCGEIFLDAEATQPTTLAEVTIPKKETEIINAKEATCEEDGYTGDRVIKGTTDVVEEGKVINKLGHKWGAYTYTWSDDYTKCTATRVCENDPTHVEKEEATITSEVTTKPTCETKGKTTYTATFATAPADTKTAENISALDHDWGEPTYAWSADYSKYTATFVCKNDASHTKSVDATVTSEVTKKAECGVKGETTYTAKFDDASLTGDTKTVANIPALEHDWGEWEVVTPATHTETGLKRRTCKLCNEVEEDIIPLVPYVYTEVKAVAATCEKDGNIAYYVRDDGKLFKDALGTEEITEADTVIPATDHKWADIVYTWNDDYTECTAVKACENDEAHNITVEGKVTAKITKEATCTEKGEVVYEATFDAEGFETQTVTEEIDTIAHEWGEWKVTKEATVDEEGEEERVCAVCGEKETRAIAKLTPAKEDDPKTDDEPEGGEGGSGSTGEGGGTEAGGEGGEGNVDPQGEGNANPSSGNTDPDNGSQGSNPVTGAASAMAAIGAAALGAIVAFKKRK